tara:strand:+ start:104 stop:391 length:288 start_codon:yes stop_codon:yes gene_type:complete
MNDYKTIVASLIDRYDHDIDNGVIGGLLPTGLSFGDLKDYVDTRLYTRLEENMTNVSYSTEEELKKIVLEMTFNILDENDMINGDMRTIYEMDFK